MDKKFNQKKLDKLNNPARLESIPPDYILEKLKLKKHSVIVDIGAGTGLFSRAFAKRLKSSVVYAADISETMISWMLENITDSHKTVIPLLMKENEVPLETSLADLILMITVHHELDKPERLLKETDRLLNPGGKICIIDWKKEEMPFGPSEEIRVTISDVETQLRSAGFKDIETDETLPMFFIVIATK